MLEILDEMLYIDTHLPGLWAFHAKIRTVSGKLGQVMASSVLDTVLSILCSLSRLIFKMTQ